MLAELTPLQRRLLEKDDQARRLTMYKLERQRATVLAQEPMSRQEALQTVEAVARGLITSDGKTRLLAVQFLARMEGWEAPRRLEHSGPGGAPIALTSVTREQASEALRDAAKRDPELAAELVRLGGVKP